MKLWRPLYEYLSMRPTKFGELSLGIGKMPSQPANTTTILPTLYLLRTTDLPINVINGPLESEGFGGFRKSMSGLDSSRMVFQTIVGPFLGTVGIRLKCQQGSSGVEDKVLF
jgi:hypothetical protein